MQQATRRGFAALLGACVIGVAATSCASPVVETAPPTTAPPVSEPAPTVSETPAQTVMPRAPVEGGCVALFADDDVAAVSGGAAAFEDDEMVGSRGELWDVGLETLGGLSCGFRGGSLSGRVIMVPAERSADLQDQFGASTCEADYDDVLCTTSRIAGSTWVFVATSGHRDVPPEVPQAQVDLLDAVADAVEDATPVGVDAEGVDLDCQALEDRAAVADVLGNDDIYPERIEEGAGPLNRRVSDALSAAVRCDWSELDDYRELRIVVVPGGTWAWEREAAARDGAREVEIAGWSARVGEDADGGSAVLVDAGEDLVQVQGRGLETDELLAAAEALLAG